MTVLRGRPTTNGRTTVRRKPRLPPSLALRLQTPLTPQFQVDIELVDAHPVGFERRRNANPSFKPVVFESLVHPKLFPKL